MDRLNKLAATVPALYTPLEYLNKIRITGTLYVGLLSHEDKAKLILHYAKKHNCRTFVETGTYKGDMINACNDFFDELFSIELSHELFLGSKGRFADIGKIHVFEGNSGNVLPEIATMIKGPALFWLDAHYSGGETARGQEDSPIIKELNFIMSRGNSPCILIDDARCFNGKSGYPRINTLKQMIRDMNKTNDANLELEVKNDIIRITKRT